MAAISLKKISLDKCDEDAFLITNFDDKCNEDYFIKLITRAETFEGNLSMDDLNNKAAAIRMTLKDFHSNTLQALTSNSGHVNFKYGLDDSAECNKVFTWTKSISSENINIVLASIPLTLVDRNAALFDILSLIADRMSSLNTKIDSLNTLQERLETEQQKTLKCLEGSVEAKEKLEREMYSKFCLVLNTKKEKIRNLKARIAELERKIDNFVSLQPSTSGQNLNTVNTELSDRDETNHQKRKKKPSKKCSLGADSSLLILDENEPDIKLVSRPRRRIRQENDHIAKTAKSQQNKSKFIPETEASELACKRDTTGPEHTRLSKDDSDELIDLL